VTSFLSFLARQVIGLRSVACLLFLASPLSHAQWHNQSQDIMGTRITVELWSEDPQKAEQAIESVVHEMRQIDARLSPYKENSDLSKLNRQAAKSAVPLSDELFLLLNKAIDYSRLSDGAFDISFASVGQFYDYREQQQPQQKTLQTHLPAIDYRSIVIDQEKRTVRFLHPLLKIDLGGIAKGYAVDRGIELLKQQGIVSAIVMAGGDSRILGDRGNQPWLLGIRHPRSKGKLAVKLPLTDTAFSTSGDYERYFLDGDKRIHHIINPSTGQSATGIQSVSVIAPDGIDSDALSTTVFVLGIEKGLALINQLEGIDAIIIDGEGKLHYSAELLMPVK